MKNKEVIIRKIHLQTFITLLNNIYMDGADFIDIHGNLDDDKDTITVSVIDEYMSPDVNNVISPPPGIDDDDDNKELDIEEIIKNSII